jgi:hypothetical protein
MIWTSTQEKDTKIVAIIDQTIYLFKPKVSEIDNYVFELNMNMIPQENMFSIPFRYINTINFYENKKMIEILFRESTEEIFMTDPAKKEEIFNYLHQNIPGFTYSVEDYSGLRAGKKQIIAILVCLVLFIWSYNIADGFEHGNLYDVEGGHYNSIAGIILVLASLGTKKLMLVFACLFTIAGLSLRRKMKNPYKVQRLTR